MMKNRDTVKFAGFATRKAAGAKAPAPAPVSPGTAIVDVPGENADPSKPCFSTWIAAKLGVPRLRATLDEAGVLKLLPAEWDISKMEGTEAFEGCKDVLRLRGAWDQLQRAIAGYEVKRREHIGRQFAGVPRRERAAYARERDLLNAYGRKLEAETERCVKEVERLKGVLEGLPDE